MLSGYDQFEYAVQALRLGGQRLPAEAVGHCKARFRFEPFRSGTGRTGFALGPDRNAADQHAENQRAGIAELFPCCVAGRRAACSLCGKRRVCARGDKNYCCVLCDGLDAQRALLERVLEQRLYGAVRTVLLRLGTPPRQAVVFCAPRTARAGLFLTLSHALTSIAVSCKRAQALDVHFLSAVLRKRPPSWSFPTANLRRLAPMRSRNRRRPLPPTRMFWPESFCRVRSRRRSSFVTSPPRYSAAAGLLLSKIAKRCSHGLWSGRSAMRHSFACACCAYAIPF